VITKGIGPQARIGPYTQDLVLTTITSCITGSVSDHAGSDECLSAHCWPLATGGPFGAVAGSSAFSSMVIGTLAKTEEAGVSANLLHDGRV
jgi:hypothetical protein